MERYKFLIEFEGTRYYGWQAQKGQRTIQGEFLNAFDKLFQGGSGEFYGAGRTDSGVHALGQVAHFDSPLDWPAQTLQLRINDLLPSDIHLLNVEKAEPRFHARHDAIYRSYVYVISKRRSAFEKAHCWWVRDLLDTNAMKNVAQLFTGMHDFRSFTDQTPEEGSTKVEIKFVDIHENQNTIAIHVTGSHFLWKMVRRMVGVLVENGRGKMDLATVEGFLNEYSSAPAAHTAPPSGLFLHKVYYQGDKLLRGTSVVPALLNFEKIS